MQSGVCVQASSSVFEKSGDPGVNCRRSVRSWQPGRLCHFSIPAERERSPDEIPVFFQKDESGRRLGIEPDGQ